MAKKTQEDKKYTSKFKTSAIFIAFILLVGTALQTTMTLFPGQLLNEAFAADVVGTDDDDNIATGSEDDNIEGRGGNDDIDSDGGNDVNTGDDRGEDGDGGDDTIDSGDGGDQNRGDNFFGSGNGGDDTIDSGD